MTVIFPRLITEMVYFWSFRHFSNAYKFWQVICWIIFGIPYSALMLTAIIIDIIRLFLFRFADLLALTIILIPVTYIVHALCAIIPLIIEQPLYWIAFLFSLPNKALDGIFVEA